MSDPISLADLIGEEPTVIPAGAPSRTCRVCEADYPFIPAHWPAPFGEPRGNTCRECNNKRGGRGKRKRDNALRQIKREAEGLVTTQAGGTNGPSMVPATWAGAQRAIAKQLDITTAIRAGVDAVNQAAPDLLARVLSYALDPESPHHEWALKMAAERVLPAKMFAELGLRAAGSGAKNGPTIQINVLPAQPGAQVVPAAITVRATEDGGDGQVGSDHSEGANDDDGTTD